jgi:hypothetical protein
MDVKQNGVKTREITPPKKASVPEQELRAAVRFPLHVPVRFKVDGKEHTAETINVSACGMLFSFEHCLEAGSTIEWQLSMPAGALGTESDVVVHCVGRVIRCYQKGAAEVEIAAVIDRYQMLP